MASAAAKDVDAYLAAQPVSARLVLETVRAAIRASLPDATESISYAIPTYKLDGKPVVYFAGWKEHWSLYPVTEDILSRVGGVPKYASVSKGTLRFPWTLPVDDVLVGRLATARAQTVTGG